ncbi:Hypp5502 [Branchiostoma lanceolatum]|uniref:Hypp5502 protein n=1 Tax=Branchiostoma lanceolatum TaxID=7740 RepID=A0A8J9VPW1_BRALA|nr:Hypp5502 [Branchiostoma lanceolatum]
MLRCGLVVIFLVGLPLNFLRCEAGMAIVGVCTSDEDCIAARGGGCCVKWNPGSAIRVCKDMGSKGNACHVSGNVLPYPFPGNRVYWRCPCREGLTCKADGEAREGICGAGNAKRSGLWKRPAQQAGMFDRLSALMTEVIEDYMDN